MFDHQLIKLIRESEERTIHAIHEAEKRILAALTIKKSTHGILKLGTPVPQ